MNRGSTLAGLPVQPGRAAIIMEEGRRLWRQRHRRLAFGEGHRWYCRPFATRPRPAQWLALLDHLLALHAAEGLDLLAIDPLAAFLPSPTENDAACVLEALAPLQRFTNRDVSVLLLHHPRKQAAAAGLAARGSGRSNEPFRYWLPGREEAWRALYGPDWEALSDEVKVTLYYRAQFLKDMPTAPVPGAAKPFLPASIPDLYAGREPDDPPGVGTRD